MMSNRNEFTCKICKVRVSAHEAKRWTGLVCPDCRRAAWVKGLYVGDSP